MVSCQSDKRSDGSAAAEEAIYMDDFQENPYKWGYINNNGRVEIPAVYEDTRDFSEGLGAVNYKGKWGYINSRNEFIIEPQYRTAYDFSEGLGIVQLFDRSYVTLDKEGQEISRNQYLEQQPYSNGRSRVKNMQGYAYLNMDGILLDSQYYRRASNYYNDIAVVQDRDGYKIIDKEQKPLTTESYDKIYGHHGKMIRYKKDQSYGYLDAKNNFQALDKVWDKAADFMDGYAVVKKGKETLILDTLGRTRSIAYSKLRNLGMGRFAFNDKAKQGIMDNNGHILVQPIYDAYYQYHDNRLAFAKADKWGYLNLDGKVVVPAILPLVWDYREGIARVAGNGGIGFIDTMGMQVVAAKYFEVKDFHQGLARVQIFK